MSHGRARSPAAAGSPARAQFAFIVATQSRTGDSRTSPAINCSMLRSCGELECDLAPIDQPKSTICRAP